MRDSLGTCSVFHTSTRIGTGERDIHYSILTFESILEYSGLWVSLVDDTDRFRRILRGLLGLELSLSVKLIYGGNRKVLNRTQILSLLFSSVCFT